MRGFSVLLAIAAIAVSVLPVPCAPQYAPERTNAMWRRLLQAPGLPGVPTTSSTGSSVLLNLCETNLCESFRAGGVCDRWAKGNNCTRRDVYFVQGDPGANDKAEMFFNLRSPFDITCSMGRCTPSDGSQYDVFVAEGCIPEKDYVSEMQDTTSRTSKQVKVYLRRKAEYYISVQRKDTAIDGGNCSYGLTTGSIESTAASRCFDFRRLSETDIVKVPRCRDVMPLFTGAVAPDTSTQATFIAALIGVGVLAIALVVLAFILIRRFRRRSQEKEAAARPKKKGGRPVVDDLEKISLGDVASPRAHAEIKKTKDIIGTAGRQQRENLAKRLANLDQDEADPGDDEGFGDIDIPGGGNRRFGRDAEDAYYGSGAGVIEDGEGVERLRKGVGGGRLVFQGSRGGSRASSAQESHNGSSGSSEERRGGPVRTPSPADELLRSQRVARHATPHSPSSKKKALSVGSRDQMSSAGSMRSAAAEDLDPQFASGAKEDKWASEAGIKIDDILEDARRATTQNLAAGRGRGAQGFVHNSRSPSVVSQASAAQSKHSSSSGGTGSDGSGGGRAIKLSPHPPQAPSSVGAPPPPPSGRGDPRPKIPAMMAARLGVVTPPPGGLLWPPGSGGGGGWGGGGGVALGMRVPLVQPPDALGRRPVPIQLSSSPHKALMPDASDEAKDAGWSVGGTTPSPPRDDLKAGAGQPGRGRAIALAGVPPPPPKELPRSNQAGVPPPPPRPGGGGAGRPASMALATSGLAQRLGALQGGNAPAVRDRGSASGSPSPSLPSPPQNRAGVQSGVGWGLRGMSPAGSERSSGSGGLGAGVSVGMGGAQSKDGRGMAALGGGLGASKGLVGGGMLGRGAPPPPPPPRRDVEGGGLPPPPQGSPPGRPTTSGGRPSTSGGRGGAIPPPPPREAKQHGD